MKPYQIIAAIATAAFCLAIILFATAALATSARANSKTHCGPNEKVIFSCKTDKKTVSVCQTTADGSVQYRYGKPGGILDISLPANVGSMDGVVKGVTTYTNAGGPYIAFRNKNTKYIVHDYIGIMGDDIGIDVERPRQATISIQCAEEPIGNLKTDIPAKVPVDPETMVR